MEERVESCSFVVEGVITVNYKIMCLNRNYPSRVRVCAEDGRRATDGRERIKFVLLINSGHHTWSSFTQRSRTSVATYWSP